MAILGNHDSYLFDSYPDQKNSTGQPQEQTITIFLSAKYQGSLDFYNYFFLELDLKNKNGTITKNRPISF